MPTLRTFDFQSSFSWCLTNMLEHVLFGVLGLCTVNPNYRFSWGWIRLLSSPATFSPRSGVYVTFSPLPQSPESFDNPVLCPHSCPWTGPCVDLCVCVVSPLPASCPTPAIMNRFCTDLVHGYGVEGRSWERGEPWLPSRFLLSGEKEHFLTM